MTSNEARNAALDFVAVGDYRSKIWRCYLLCVGWLLEVLSAACAASRAELAPWLDTPYGATAKVARRVQH